MTEYLSRSDTYTLLCISVFQQPCKTDGDTDENTELEKLKY